MTKRKFQRPKPEFNERQGVTPEREYKAQPFQQEEDLPQKGNQREREERRGGRQQEQRPKHRM